MKNKTTAAVIEELACCGLNSRGQGLCRPADGPVTFVDGLLPGERAVVRITAAKKNYRAGAVERLIEASPRRVEPRCPWAGSCGGCGLAHADYEAQLDFKAQLALDAFRRIGGLALDALTVTPSPRAWGYRNKAGFPVTPRGVGFYAPNSHRLVPVDRCPLVLPELERAYGVLRNHPLMKGLQPYDERTGRGLLRHLVLRGDGRGAVLALLVLNSTAVPPSVQRAARSLMDDANLCGVVANFNTGAGNRMLTEHTRLLAGTDRLTHRLGGYELTHDGTAFFQVNDGAAELLFTAAAEGVRGKTLELFCGVGALTRFVAPRVETLLAVELWEPSVRQARRNMAGLDHVELHLADAQTVDERLFDGMDTVVVDPPRSGLSPHTVELIGKSGASRLVYVSCDPATLARDLAALLSGPRPFHLDRLQAFDLFPQTPHVETVCLMTR